jgi:organic hydroperoxide reductase OsmC/OhrA
MLAIVDAETAIGESAIVGDTPMKPLPHHYDVHLSGGPTGYAELSTAGVPALRTAPPADYDGPGDAWSPEHLLLASVQACFLFTLRAIARVSKLEFTGLELEASGTVDRKDGVTRFTEIVLRPRVSVAVGTNRERLLQILEKSEKTCLVSASLSTPLRLEPDIHEV